MIKFATRIKNKGFLMLFGLIILTFILIGLFSFLGDYERDEIRRDYKEYERIIKGK